MRDNMQVKTQKDFFNFRSNKYKRIVNAAVNLTTFSPHKLKNNGPNMIEFPMIQSVIEKQKKSSSHLVSQKKIVKQELVKKFNQKQSKSLIKHVQENKRQKFVDSMNMLGLDVFRIKRLSQQNKSQMKRQENFRKISKISQKMSEISVKRQFSIQLTNTQRKKSQAIQTFDGLIKFQMTKSFIIMNERKSTNSGESYNKRKVSINYGQQDNISPCTTGTISPSKLRQINKNQYLYKKLEGAQSRKRQEFGQVYERRIKSYLDMLFKVQISYNITFNLDLKIQDVNNRPKKLKAFVGPGNNGAMIKGLLKRRFWWTIVEEKTQDCHFVWTQIKINQIFKKQLRMSSQKPIFRKIQPQVTNSLSRKSYYKKRKSLQTKNKQQKFFQNNQLYNYKLMHQKDKIIYIKALQKISQRYRQLTYEQKAACIQKTLQSQQQKNQHLIHNHLQNNFYLGNKKALFHNLKEYYGLIKQDPFDYIPFTFHIKNGIKDPEYIKFCQYYRKRNKLIKKQEKEEQQGYSGNKKTRNIWIVKPGQNSNQGRGISVIDEVYELNLIMKHNSKNKTHKKKLQTSSTIASTNNNQNQSQQNQQTEKRTFIVQMYIDRPFLYNNRKFDIRHYMLITNFFGITRAYWYEEGYIRTSSYEFNIHSFQPEIHLTNDAVQNEFPDYHKYQPYNKISYEEFQRYLDLNYSKKKYSFKQQILSKMKRMATDAAKSVFTKICPQNAMNNFQIFGLDFMIDKDFKPWLIQINTNPCLDCACPLLDRIIPYMIEQSFKLSLDLAYPPPYHYPNTYRHFAPLINLQTFKYQLIFDSQVQGDELIALYRKVKGNLIQQIGEIEEDETFKDEGKQIRLDDFA